MRFLVLTSKPDSPYVDTARSYEYPARYRRFFTPLETGEPMIAIIYEPRSGGRGRMAYVGWAALRGAPVKSSRSTAQGQPLWEVHYVDHVQEFPNSVPRDYLGTPLERWLREMVPEHRNVVSSGASVRFVDEAEGSFILELGHAGELGIAGDYSTPSVEADVLVAERTRRVVGAVERDARFRRDLMVAYDYRCAVTGLTIGALPHGRATRLLDAAHIRPVGANGSDSVTNGLSLTPTVHRLFDEGLITAQRSGAEIVLLRSPLLEPGMIAAPERGTDIRIESGARLILPPDRSQWPHAEQLKFHQRNVFKGPESLLL